MKDHAAIDGIEARTRMLTLKADALTLKDMDPKLSAEMPDLLPQIERICVHLENDPAKFRLIRPFIVVHAPSLQAALWLVIKAETTGAMTQELREEVSPSFKRAAQLVAEALDRLDNSLAHDLVVEISTLAERAPALFEITEPVREGKPGLLGRFMPASLKSAKDATLDAVAQTARITKSVAIDGVIDSTAWALNAVYRIPSYGATWTKEGLAHLEASTLDPVAVRLKAAQHGLAAGATSGVALGMLAGILCPPLLPVVAIDAVFMALNGYDQGLLQAQRLKGAEREAQIARLKEERAQILKEIAGGAEVYQIDAGPLNVVVDARTGQIERIISDGEFAGRRLEDLSKAEREKFLTKA